MTTSLVWTPATTFANLSGNQQVSLLDAVFASIQTAFSGKAAAISDVDGELAAVFRSELVTGLAVTHDATTPNSVVDVAAGSCASSDFTTLLLLATAFTGSTAGTWVAGTGQNKLDTGTVAANTQYFIHVIGGGNNTADILFSVSSTSPTMPGTYTKRRVVSSFKTQPASTNILIGSLISFAGDRNVPTGILLPYAGTYAPSGWLLCDGSAVSRATFGSLFAAIGTTYGAGDGSTTFNVPDLRGRVPAGKDDMGGSAANRITAAGSGITGTTLGAAGGTETHTLVAVEMPVHNHPVNDPGHFHNIPDRIGTTVTGNVQSGGVNGVIDGGSQTSIGNATTGITTGAAGSGGAHQNTQPSIITNYIIKT